MEGIRNFARVLLSLLLVLSVAVTLATADNLPTQNAEEALNQLRPLVQDILYKGYMHRDDYLLPFLRARNFDVNKTVDMLKAAINWRLENRIDELKDEDDTVAEECVKMYHGGRDKQGRPIYYAAAGTWNIRKCIEDGKVEALKRYFIKMHWEGMTSQAMALKNPKTGEIVTQFHVLEDLGGFNLMKGGCLACLRFFAGLAYIHENYYPGRMYKAQIVNAPGPFRILLDFVNPILTAASQNALQIKWYPDNQWKEELLKEIDIDQLPEMFGGNWKDTTTDGRGFN